MLLVEGAPREAAEAEAHLPEPSVGQPFPGDLLELGVDLGLRAAPPVVATHLEAPASHLVHHRAQRRTRAAGEAEGRQLHDRLLGHLQRAQAQVAVELAPLLGGFVDARRPAVVPAVLEPVARGRLAVGLRAQRIAGREGDRPANGVGHEPAAAGDAQVVLVLLSRERRERVVAVVAHGTLHLGGRGLLAPAQDHRPQHQHQQVEAGRPARELQRPEKARRGRSQRVDAGLEDQQAGAQRLERGRVAAIPAEVPLQIGEPDEPEHPDREREHRSHHERLAQRGGIASRGEAGAEGDQIGEQQRSHQRVVEVERAQGV